MSDPNGLTWAATVVVSLAVAESTQTRIDQAIRDIVMGVFDRAYRILEINREVLEPLLPLCPKDPPHE
ncbi:MAG: hypothetical protein COA51_01395 [Idiomarina sp.]|nr:MAG: hypothetical protein COA51_01395 [Idiomarina sp.]